MKNLTVALVESDLDKIDQWAKIEKRPLSAMARILLEEALEARSTRVEGSELCASVDCTSTG